MAKLHEDWTGLLGLVCPECLGDGDDGGDFNSPPNVKDCPICQGTGYRKPEPQEVDDWLAVNVMGWIGGCIRWDWAPLTDANHALMLAQSVCDGPRSSHIIIPVLTPGGNKVGVWAFRAVAYPFPPKDLLAHLDYCSSDALRLQADTFCEALCLAAAKARVEARDHE